LHKKIGQFIHGRVLEVGAGIGANTRVLYSARVCEWTCLEPDPDLAGRIKGPRKRGDFPCCCRVVNGTIAALESAGPFDTIIYIDVLEHIADDRAELACAARLLSPQGCVIVLSPAHQFLFSPFDQAVGHYRRYSRATLRDLTPPDCVLQISIMLDSVGFFASMANRFLLSAPLPSKRQIAVWDKLLVPVSRVLDRITGYRFGKSVVAVWRKAAGSSDGLLF
jgi:SAM-dependent methyltransferase